MTPPNSVLTRPELCDRSLVLIDEIELRDLEPDEELAACDAVLQELAVAISRL